MNSNNQTIPARFERATPGFGGRSSDQLTSFAPERAVSSRPVFEAFEQAPNPSRAVGFGATSALLAPGRHRAVLSGVRRG